MAAVQLGFVALCLFSTCFIVILHEYEAVSIPPCSKGNFGEYTLKCEKGMRKKAFYMHTDCDLNHANSIPHPKPIDNLPCHCEPGKGLEAPNATKCTECAKGFFSHGGELIDDWSEWNTSNSKGAPGLYYGVDTYCSDFLSGKSCNAWRPSADNTFLVSGEFKNSTQLRCFEQSMLILSRNFLLTPKENKVSFEYKVDGASCRRGSDTCSQGLHFYINGKQVLKTDTQFHWKTFESKEIIQPGITKLKFVYHKSCTRDPILDVAYIRHLSLVGTDAKLAQCTPCNAGSVSEAPGSKECRKCTQNEYQEKKGQSQCKQCDIEKFSKIGATECSELPICKESDFYIKPEAIKTCRKNGTTDTYIRKQIKRLPEWPGTTHNPCKRNDTITQPPDVQCRCGSGYAIDVSNPNDIKCKECKTGFYSNGSLTKCQQCDAGYAAVPGHYLDDFTGDKIPGILKQNCSGKYCQTKNKQYWIPRGSYMATRRIPGNFELTLKFNDVVIDYYDAKLTFNCSVDCRMSKDSERMAKHDHCFMRFAIQKWNETGKNYYSIIEDDCVSRYRAKSRDGRMMKHEFPIREKGKYSFTALFHHEDEGNFSLLSYEARIYHVDISGSISGNAKQCVKCPAGTFLTDKRAFCKKCPIGTFSEEGAKKCMPCPEGEFADKEGSGKCTKCGANTSSNIKRDGCDYNGCQYTFIGNDQKKNVYDLSPLQVDGGPMYKVRTYKPKSKYFFPLYYYINICSLKHDNSSCTTMKRTESTGTKKTTERKSTILKTMACKRWSFDENHSYSIGEVMSFLPLKGRETEGLLIQLEGGYKCWNKLKKMYQVPVTKIQMECDMFAEIGYPEPRDNETAIDVNCVFELKWRTVYACRICGPDDYTTVEGVCANGHKMVTHIRNRKCRALDGSPDVTVKSQLCDESITGDGGKLTKTAKKDNTPLIVAIVIAALVIVILVVFVYYYAKRNRYLRGRLFVPGKSFSKVQEEDEDELVDNMS